MTIVAQSLSSNTQLPLFSAPGFDALPLILKEDTWSGFGPIWSAGVPPTAKVVLPFDKAAALAESGRTESSWAAERLEWETLHVLRTLLADVDDSLCDKCGVEGRVLQHALSDRQRLTPYRCQHRATCPACGRAYSQSRGNELVGLLDAVLEPGRLVVAAPEVSAWHIVLSCDSRISRHVDQLVKALDVDQVRRILRHLTEDVQHTIEHVFGPGAAAVVAWHWWHSSDPLSGHHLHAHVTVPNVSVTRDDELGVWSPDMRSLRSRGTLTADELSKLRLEFGRRVTAHRWAKGLVSAPVAGESLPDQWKSNAHVRFTRGRDGRGYEHRLRYDGRTSVSDLYALVEPPELRAARQLHADELGESELAGAVVDIAELACNPDALAVWVQAAYLWQGIQTIRYTGWLVNAARKSLGLLRDSETEDEPEWTSVGFYTLTDFGPNGLVVERWREGVRRFESWHFDHVQLVPPPSRSTAWQWSDTVRPKRKAGPPLSWLARSGIG